MGYRVFFDTHATAERLILSSANDYVGKSTNFNKYIHYYNITARNKSLIKPRVHNICNKLYRIRTQTVRFRIQRRAT